MEGVIYNFFNVINLKLRKQLKRTLVEFSSQFEKSMKKLKKKDEEMFLRIQKNLKDIVQHPNHYKNLKNVLADYQRIHFGSFVLYSK